MVLKASVFVESTGVVVCWNESAVKKEKERCSSATLSLLEGASRGVH